MDRLTKLFNNDATVMSAWSSVQDTLYLSTLSDTAFDAITLDMQHGMQTEDSVIRGIAAIAPKGKPVVVRIPVGRYDFASKALDAGAHGIIAPMVNTVEDAQQLVSFTKYIPVGDRSFGPTQAVSTLGLDRTDYLKGANSKTLNFAMIETVEAVENMEAILDVDGIDGVFCGPGDLSVSVRQDIIPDLFGPDTLPIIERMGAAARERNKMASVFCVGPDHVEIAQKAGYRFIAMGFDLSYLTNGANRMLSELSFR